MVACHDANAFHMPARFPPEPGLFEKVSTLRRNHRPGAALELVLGVLRRDPGSADAYWCALMLCSCRPALSGGGCEPIVAEQLSDPLLAPIRTVCTRCRVAWWFSSHELELHAYARITAINPIGLQCQQCRYTLCRNCLNTSRGCPQKGCPGKLAAPVLATGPPLSCPPPQRGWNISW